MSQEHEYALLGGYNRANVGRWLARLAAAISAVSVFLMLAAVDLAKYLGVNANIPPSVLSLVGAGLMYTALYWLFDQHAWKYGPLGKLLRVTNLAGEWLCDGLSLEVEPHTPWQGKVVIIQSWDKIRVHLQTQQSSSDSVSAALQYDAAVGFRLLYHYRNSPRLEEKSLVPHHGFAEIIFSHDGDTATGEYFNGRGRYTYGTMKLRRKSTNAS